MAHSVDKDKAKKKRTQTSRPQHQKRKTHTVRLHRLRILMAQHGIYTYAELARRLRMRPDTVRHLAAGSKWLPKRARQIEAFLGVEPFSIFKPIPLQTSVKGRKGRTATTAPAEKTRGES